MKKQPLMIVTGLLTSLVILGACQKDERPNQTATSSSSEIAKKIISKPVEKTIETSSTQVTDEPSKALVFDEHTYEYDVVTGATETTFGTNPPAKYSYEEKMTKMFWSNQPPIGLLEGNYYRNEGEFDGDYIGTVEVVTDEEANIINVEYNELTRTNYYEAKYSRASKRLSDYAFFQSLHTRTDDTLVTVVNGITFLERQMREENRVDGQFETVKGSSTSARNGFMPLAAAMAEEIRKPSDRHYYGYAEKDDAGITGRVQLVMKDGEIESLRYDEYFADYEKEISDKKLKQFYRQSKYYSLDYREVTGDDFQTFADELSAIVLKNQDVKAGSSKLQDHPSYATYLKLIEMIPIK